uniref:Uncharacterized protein n=1 Tax=Rhizophora mucronata TaxID=61149 RepID=A0A2P2MYM6_RHIMU
MTGSFGAAPTSFGITGFFKMDGETRSGFACNFG